MSALDQEEGSDEPNASTPFVGGGKVKPVEDKLVLDPVSLSGQNDVTSNGGKRKRRDWRAFAIENGGARRRSLRSDTARVLVETELGTERGAVTRSKLSELESVDSNRCRDDLQMSKGKLGQLKAKVKKGSNECGVGSVSAKEITKIGESGHQSSRVLGAGESKESDGAINGIAGNDFPSGKKVERLVDTIGKEGTQLLDATQSEGIDDRGDSEELEGRRTGGTEDEVTACAVTDNVGTENIQCETGKVDLSYKSSNGATGIEVLKIEAGPTGVQGKGLAEAEEKIIVGTQFNVPKEVKKKVFTAKKRTPVQVEPLIVERRITRSSAAKQKRIDENAIETEGARITEDQMEEENSGLDQTDTHDNELLKNIKLKKNKKMRSDRIKSLNLTDSDEDFNPMRKITGKKKGKEEGEGDSSVLSGTRREPPSKRKKLKMAKEQAEEVSKVVGRRNRPKVESEESDSSSHRMVRLTKRKIPKIERDDSGSNSDFLGSDHEAPPKMKRRGRPPGLKNTTQEAKLDKTIKEKERLGQPRASKNLSKLDNKPRKTINREEGRKVVKVDSLSQLDNKPRKIAKEIVSGMIKDLLSKHGWTVEMRPRFGRDYADQVYVAPDGTTHWSVTKAYYAFLEKMKSLQNLSTDKQVADFTPIPEELLDILKRTICKERSDAGKKNKLKGKKKRKGKWLAVKSKKFKKGRLKKKKNREGLNSASSDFDEMDVGLNSVSKKSNTGRGRKKKGRLALLARGSHEGEASGENDYMPYEWKRTVLSWMIDLDVVSENGKVKYIDSDKPDPLAEGKIIRDGIKCDCCEKIFTVSDFGVHAGAENGSSFLSKLFLEEAGACLLQCLVRAWEKQCTISEPKGFFLSSEANGVDQNDDTCGVCGDGGDLVCCDKCPSTFHLGCLGIEMLPSGEWHCPYCSCSFCTKLSSSPLLSCTQCNDRCTCF